MSRLTEGELLRLSELYDASGYQQAAADVLNHLATNAFEAGQIEAAMSHASNSLRHSKSLSFSALQSHLTLMKAEAALSEDEMSPCSSDLHLDAVLRVSKHLFESGKKAHPLQIDIQQGLAMQYAQRGDWEAAIQHFQGCVELSKLVCGEQHPRVAECLLLLGKAHEATGAQHSALRNFETATAIMWKVKETFENQDQNQDQDQDKLLELPRQILDSMATCFESYASSLGKYSDKSDWAAAYMWAKRGASVNRANRSCPQHVKHRSNQGQGYG